MPRGQLQWNQYSSKYTISNLTQNLIVSNLQVDSVFVECNENIGTRVGMTGTDKYLIDRAIGLKLRYARRQKMMLQEDLAKFCSISLELLIKYEKGRLRIPSEQLQHLAQVLDKPIAWFYKKMESQHINPSYSEEDEEYAECLLLLSRIRKNGTLQLVKDILKQAATDD